MFSNSQCRLAPTPSYPASVRIKNTRVFFRFEAKIDSSGLNWKGGGGVGVGEGGRKNRLWRLREFISKTH